ncbi:long-chain fatty acid transport protein 6 isoform X2 [Fundulus heteroclitus]|uniref:long-chain fatty acid transport protein 6 isoform X2 n=1 Tax=Fundulus heteroclitus TaxID=8078 RepID=UPI00165B2C18|nr:long-chain fatty acid transport protein 6 isoform X2 [Fundulus heteroclitus]
MSASLSWLSALAAGLLAARVVQKLWFPYFWRDLFFLMKVIRYGVKLELFKLTASVHTVLDRFIEQAQRIPNKPFVIYDGTVYTYRDMELRSNRLANVFLHNVHLKKGDCVALLMSNEPDFLSAWFGLAKVGCSVAFLNFNIKSKSLLHCFDCCGAKTLIIGSDLLECLDGILPSLLKSSIQVWTMKSHCEHPQVHTLQDKIDAASHQPVPAVLRATNSLKKPNLYIFTSGTTGLPKAAVITHLQSLKAAGGFWAFGATEADVIYIPLPLYHSAASLIGIGGTIELGATCVLKKKFSASQFWTDCKKYEVTIFQYIGELCRYLCNQPKLLFKYDLVKYDMTKEETVKDLHGFCQRVKKGETGLLLAKVSTLSPFFGYAGSKQLTEKKLMKNVFVKGDTYFNTGDLMAEDKDGFICFKDRVGDTFRWKGENVATTEVTEILGLVDFIQEVNVYGVEVPGHEGRAGMAALILRPGLRFDGKKLFEHANRDLPTYACPLFVRLQEVMEMTSTFKQQKFQLVHSGFNPSTISDPLYVLDYQQKSYIPLTQLIYNSIICGERKL